MSSRRRSARTLSRRLLAAGAVAAPVFVAAFLVEGAVRPGYDPLRHPVSSLSLGPGGWSQRASFWATGTLYLAGSAGLWRSRDLPGLRTTAGPILLGTVGLGLIGAGIFAADPINGYPPGSVAGAVPTSSSRLHDLCSSPVFLCLPAAAVVYARASARDGSRGWMWGSWGAAVVQLSAFVVAGAGFSGRPRLVPVGGLFQRASIVTGLGWLSALCVRASNAQR